MELKRFWNIVELREWIRSQYFSIHEIQDKFCIKAQTLLDNDTVYDIDKQCTNCQYKCSMVLSLTPNKGY